ncbi:hypothetical protein Gotri_022579 [Gossypium trilobum]|uniref:DUF4283 domain-containing protein n=1 Tax=Gossypium trilobum TaxID=34281 RepID=A0A7J9DG77_9ROSI|nr:hypothetical protein [Gossypium trilobum]
MSSQSVNNVYSCSSGPPLEDDSSDTSLKLGLRLWVLIVKVVGLKSANIDSSASQLSLSDSEEINGDMCSVDFLQGTLSDIWRLRFRIIVISRDDNSYVIKVVLLMVTRWKPNVYLNRDLFSYVDKWVHNWGLPLEYHRPFVARRIAQVAGEVLRIDWENIAAWNIRYLRVCPRLRP